MTLGNPSPELLTVLIRELTGGEDDLTPIRYPHLARGRRYRMRKSFNGLGEQVQHVLDETPSQVTCLSFVADGVTLLKYSGRC